MGKIANLQGVELTVDDVANSVLFLAKMRQGMSVGLILWLMVASLAQITCYGSLDDA